MTDRGRDSLELTDEDRLPWLEPAEEDEAEGVNVGRVVAFVLGGLLVLAAVIGGIYWWQGRDATFEGEGELIAAPEGDYKVKPEEPGGMAIEGEGDSTFAASEGVDPGARIDTSALPEAPVERPQPKPAERDAAPPARQASSALPESGGALVAKAPAGEPRTPGRAGSGTVVQLGAFDSESGANTQWKRKAERFAYLGALQPIVARAVVGGRTYYRLRADAGAPDAARDICAKLKVAGEDCLVVAN